MIWLAGPEGYFGWISETPSIAGLSNAQALIAEELPLTFGVELELTRFGGA